MIDNSITFTRLGHATCPWLFLRWAPKILVDWAEILNMLWGMLCAIFREKNSWLGQVSNYNVVRDTTSEQFLQKNCLFSIQLTVSLRFTIDLNGNIVHLSSGLHHIWDLTSWPLVSRPRSVNLAVSTMTHTVSFYWAQITLRWRAVKLMKKTSVFTFRVTPWSPELESAAHFFPNRPDCYTPWICPLSTRVTQLTSHGFAGEGSVVRYGNAKQWK